MIGDIDTQNDPISAYQPPQDVIDLTKVVKEAYAEGERILDRPWLELNYRNIEQDENNGQLMFNAFVDEGEEESAEDWKWRGTRSMARNKGVAMHAQLTSNFLIPLFVGQNESQEIDRDMSEIMNNVAEWIAQPTNSEYQSSFIQATFGMMTNPVTYMGAEFFEVMQSVKQKMSDGSFEFKEVVDEILSGFKASIYSSSQVLISNAYERNMQKQKAIIERRWVEKSELEAKYRDHENWIFVQEGIRSVYNDEDGLFYDIKDDEHLHLVAEEIYKNRREDLETPFVSGIYMGKEDTENNPIRHRETLKDKLTGEIISVPKYNKVPFGFSRIGSHFFYFKSMMNVLQWDNMLYDAMSEIVMNRAFLEVEMPILISGSEQIDTEVVFPNAVLTSEDPDTKVQQLLPNSNMVAGFNALRETEKAMDDESVSGTVAGQLPQASQKAFSVAQARADAKKIIGSVGKSLAESMIKYGDLMKDIIINNITVPQTQKLINGQLALKYPTFFLENKNTAGKMSDKIIKFDTSLLGLKLTKQEKIQREMELLEETDFPNNNKTLAKVNPEIFASLRYLSKIELTEMFNKSSEFRENLFLTIRQQFANDPNIDLKTLDQKTVFAMLGNEGNEIIRDDPAIPQLATGAEQAPPIEGGQGQQTIQGNKVIT